MKNHMIKKTLNAVIALTIVVFVLSSCKNNKLDHFPLSSVTMKFAEELPAGTGNLHFYFMTDDDYECQGFPIRYEQQSDELGINIYLKDVEEISTCITPGGPAYVDINIGNFMSGSYALSIKVGDIENTGTLTVSESQYIISIDNPQMLTLVYDTMQRVPENIIWGVVAYNLPDAAATANAYLDSIQNVGAQPTTLAPGDYGYFQADTTGKIVAPDDLGYKYTKTYVYNYDQSWETLVGIVNYYSIYNPHTFIIYLYNSEGQRHTSY
jgi:hypothetical protein